MKIKNQPQTDLPTQEGTVITVFGSQAEIEDNVGKIIRCHLRKNMGPLTTGDRILWAEEQGAPVIISLLPRKSLLARPENAHKTKLIAANIDLLIIVTAPPPLLAEDMIDRYLIAADSLHIQPIILLNKIDLIADQSNVIQRIRFYEQLNYAVILSSAITHNGLEQLSEWLMQKTGVLVGASGVGKSSIIAALTGNTTVRTGAVSLAGLGKHTTTTAHLYHLPNGGQLIDSPGIREFGLWHMDAKEILQGFIEFKPFLNQCKFRDCSHLKEPGCALQQAIKDQKISERRFESYKKMIGMIPRRV